MDKVINLGIPHVAENILAHLTDDQLLECLKVSKTWENIAQELLILRWRDNLQVPIQKGLTNIVQGMLDHPECGSINWNTSLSLQLEVPTIWIFNPYTTPFLLACESGNLRMVRLFLKYARSKNIDLNARGGNGLTGFHIACRDGHMDIVKELLDNSRDLEIDVNAQTFRFRTNGLDFAINNKHFEVANLILQHSDSDSDSDSAAASVHKAIITDEELEDEETIYFEKHQQNYAK